MGYRVPFVDPRTHYRRLKAEIDAAIIGCLTRGDLIYRQDLKQFEEELASFVGTKYAVGLNSGYHALHFALLGAGVGPGDEVITVAHTFVATISAILHCGATPVLVDVGADYNLDPDRLRRAISDRTKAILPVHLNGRLCDMDPIMALAERHGLLVIEDAAQALGATQRGRKAGSFGAAGCFSFYPFKILGGFGDGGAITTNDPQLARMASLLRYNGEDRETGEYHYHGQTALLDNVQAAVLSVKLKYLPDWIEHRRKIAALYRGGAGGRRRPPPASLRRRREPGCVPELRHPDAGPRPVSNLLERTGRGDPGSLAKAGLGASGFEAGEPQSSRNGAHLPRGGLVAHERRDHGGARGDHGLRHPGVLRLTAGYARMPWGHREEAPWDCL